MKPIKHSIFICLALIALASCDPGEDHTISRCIVTGHASSITTTGATIEGAIVCSGIAITERGFYWGTAHHPETTGTKILAGSGTGAFAVNLSCLSPHVRYYTKAYAVTSKGTFFGSEMEFVTLDYDAFTDARDGQVYKTIRVGSQTWMAENLNYATATNSYCYDDLSANCDEYGRLYLWNEALLAVPAGWHLPSRAEAEVLIAHFSSPENAYTQLIQGGCSAFNSRFAGIRNHESTPYFGLGVYADYLTTTEQSSDWIWIMDLNTSDQRAVIGADRKSRGFSVRCIKDAPVPDMP